MNKMCKIRETWTFLKKKSKCSVYLYFQTYNINSSKALLSLKK